MPDRKRCTGCDKFEDELASVGACEVYLQLRESAMITVPPS